MPDTNVTLALLAGGAGLRMGKPKGLLRVNDRPILEYLSEQYDWPGASLLVTAPQREHPPGAECFTRECTDPIAGQGPLRGVLTALEHASTPLVLIAAVDMPMIRRTHLRWLIDSMQHRPHALAILQARHVDGRRQIEPFPSIFHTGAAKIVRRRIQSGLMSVSKLVDDEDAFVAIEADWEPAAWLNLNHPQDLTTLAQHRLHIQ